MLEGFIILRMVLARVEIIGDHLFNLYLAFVRHIFVYGRLIKYIFFCKLHIFFKAEHSNK